MHATTGSNEYNFNDTQTFLADDNHLSRERKGLCN